MPPCIPPPPRYKGPYGVVPCYTVSKDVVKGLRVRSVFEGGRKGLTSVTPVVLPAFLTCTTVLKAHQLTRPGGSIRRRKTARPSQ